MNQDKNRKSKRESMDEDFGEIFQKAKEDIE
jgi:hypothetical protein